MKSKVRKAVFPVAGLGTRFLPATKSIPKEIMTLVDRPLMQYAIDEARSSGIEEFIFVTSRGKGALENYFDRAPQLESILRAKENTELLEVLNATVMESGTIAYVRQHDPLGLGHAVWCARYLIGDEPFAVILTDDIIVSEKPALRQMIDTYNEVGGIVVALAEVPVEQSSNYGLVEVYGKRGRLVSIGGMVEKPKPANAPSNLAIVGRYILTPKVLNNLENSKPGAGGEIQLTDAIAIEANTRNAVHGLLYEGERFDCGSKSGFLQAAVSIALLRPDLRDEFREFLVQALAEAGSRNHPMTGNR